MKNKKSFRIITAALFSAFAVVTSLVIHIPIPGTTGYLNISDSFTISAVILLGPVYGMLSGITGGILSDIVAGNPIYIPATLVIKSISSLMVWFICKASEKHFNNSTSLILSSITDIIPVTAGYFIFEYFFLFGKASVIGIPFNLLQGLVSSVLSIIIIKGMKKSHLFNSTERN